MFAASCWQLVVALGLCTSSIHHSCTRDHDDDNDDDAGTRFRLARWCPCRRVLLAACHHSGAKTRTSSNRVDGRKTQSKTTRNTRGFRLVADGTSAVVGHIIIVVALRSNVLSRILSSHTLFRNSHNEFTSVFVSLSFFPLFLEQCLFASCGSSRLPFLNALTLVHVGRKFAYVSLKTALSWLMRNYEMEFVGGAIPKEDFTTMVVAPVAPVTVRYKRIKY